MHKRTIRVVTLAASTACALGLAWLVWRARDQAGPRVLDQRASVERVLLERAVAPRGLGPFELRPGLQTLAREPLDEATVRRIFAMGPGLVWDPQQYYRYDSNLDQELSFAELPGGTYRRRTNALGYREDHEFPTPRPDLVILATGDSHTDGLCENPDTWPNRLEELLGARRAGRSVEVLNAGVQTFSFYHYLGAVERALSLRPDAVVTLCYGGNDFLEVNLLHHLFQKTAPPPRSPDYWAAFSAARGVEDPELTQILYEAHRFERSPDEAERALDAAAAVCAEIQRVCDAQGIPWVFAYLPSAYCVPWRELAAERARDLAALALTEAALERIDGLADRLLAILRTRGVPVVDLRPNLHRMAEAGEPPPYWQEFHLNPQGNRLVAEWLLPEVERALEARR
ncbi:MAG: hypothetical protein JNK02_08325 [Planctomycetes bacterium]|nr:hypothetical protein [Planctomycetota bacterium]